MDFVTAIAACFGQYATFDGRASRAEFWYFTVFVAIGGAVFHLLDFVLFPAMDEPPLGSIFKVLVLLPLLSVAARRLHDIDKSGWWQFINFVPLVGSIIFLIWTTSLGTRGPNRFGDPVVKVAAMA